MSFSREVKEEIGRNISRKRHCQIAEIAALFFIYGEIIPHNEENGRIKILTENLTAAKKYIILMKKAYDFIPDMIVRNRENSKKKQIEIRISDQEVIERFSKEQKQIDKICCKRAWIRGLFLAVGSVNSPDYGYHFEFVLEGEEKAKKVISVLSEFGVFAKTVKRKKYCVVYVKEGSQIVDLLNVMEAHVALMKFENVRILKEMRNTINRQVNCEAANIKKTVSASARQVEDICYIRDELGFGVLPDGLVKVAMLRVEHEEATLKELGEMLDPPIGKSGVNHRLRKISETADVLRRQHKEENQ
ncbi:MAG: DNA-binding protein WhiA [Lachnoclostridium sp.]|jgi:DNA-binding protein WhiA|nr:DNA-binding protein WhiA [Lachnoclostridium sp.]